MPNDILTPLPDTIEILRTCEQCCAQWEAFKRAHGLPRGSNASDMPVPQSPTELVMEATGCDALAALQELMRAQRLGLVILPGNGLGEPVITAEGRQFLAEAQEAERQEERRRRKAAARGLNYAGWSWGSKLGWRTEDDEVRVIQRWEARKGRRRMTREGMEGQEGWDLPSTPMLAWAQSCSERGRLVP